MSKQQPFDSAMTLKIHNRDARRLWLNINLLAKTPTGRLDLLRIIKQLGFVQLDTIRNVSRAHHHILWSRNQNYREPMLGKLLSEDRAIFEHFTHDASVLPMEYYPMWARQFLRLGKRAKNSASFRKAKTRADYRQIKQRIRNEGPLSTHAFDTKITGKKEMWDRPPHKRALDMMWYAGELTTSHRKNFTKYYDLTERVIPTEYLQTETSDTDQLDWLCQNAIQRLGFGTVGDIQKFWAAADAREVNIWAAKKCSGLSPVKIQTTDGNWYDGFAPDNIEQRLQEMVRSTSRMRILSPFDPVVRYRTRLQRLFGFEYRIEIFVPAAQRKWGYYVYPLLEGERFVGRIDLKANRNAGILTINNLWPEPGITWTANRQNKLDSELARLARFIGVQQIDWLCSKPAKT